MNTIPTREFIQQKFAEYYREHLSSIQPPTLMEKREFAFLLFKEGAMLRHRGYKSIEDFRLSLQGLAPSDVYYSSAYYENPEESMDAKGWLGADLIFDIDADHIPTPCDKQHDTWNCKNCGISGRGTKPEKCPKCGGQKFNETSWPCSICLETAKKETIKLIDILDKDFGLSPAEMNLAFSGNRGYHVHIENEAMRTLDSMARKEIVDYMLGIGLDPKLFGFEKGVGPSLDDSGWRGRIAKGTYELLSTSGEEQLLRVGVKKKAAADVVQQRDKILASWKVSGPWKTLKGVGDDGWRRIIQQAIDRQSVKIDTVVTTDVHRLIRLADTLHGETGLKKIKVEINEIEGFDPFRQAVAFNEGTLMVDVAEAPQFGLGENTYGPYKGEKAELQMAAAMLLLCKGAAKIMEDLNVVQ